MNISQELENRYVLLCVVCKENPQREDCKTCSMECSKLYNKTHKSFYQKIYYQENKAYRKAFLKVYHKSDKYKAYLKVYHKSDKYKAYQKAYKKTDKYKAYLKAYYLEKKQEIENEN